MIQVLYLGRVNYEDALRMQAEVEAWRYAKRVHNVLLLLEHPPVLTLGRHADRSNVLASEEQLRQRGITLHPISRGGDVTYHGPGQLVGYPIFDLRSMRTAKGNRMGPVDFVRGMEEVLMRVCGRYGIPAERIAGLTGVWCTGPAGSNRGPADSSRASRLSVPDETTSPNAAPEPEKKPRKIAAIGIHVSRGITSHGFAFNVTTDLRYFKLIIPCGIADKPVTSLEAEVLRTPDVPTSEPEKLPTLEEVANEASRQFGLVFNEQMLAVDSYANLRAQAEREFPAQDVPLQVPEAIRRLTGKPEKTDMA